MPVIVSRLSRLLGERRMSVQRLADLSGVSRRALHDLYHDRSHRVDYATLDRVCRVLEIGVGELLEYTPDASNNVAAVSGADRGGWGQIDRLGDRGPDVRNLVLALKTAYQASDGDTVRWQAEALAEFLPAGPSLARTLLDRLLQAGV